MRTLCAALVFFVLGGSLLAQEEPPRLTDPEVANPLHAPEFMGLYLWKQALWQYTANAQGKYSVERGDPWGGRIVGGLGFGRFGIEGRADVSGLQEQFSIEDPETFQTLEVYGAVHYVWLARSGFQIGPVVAAGSISHDDSVGGIKMNFWGGGVRLAGAGAEFHFAIGKHDYLPTGGWRCSISGHLPIYGRVYLVGDLVSGQDGYARVGVAFRAR